MERDPSPAGTVLAGEAQRERRRLLLLHPTSQLLATDGEAPPNWPENRLNPPKRGSQRSSGRGEDGQEAAGSTAGTGSSQGT